MSIETKAKEAYSWFTKSTRADGSTTYWHTKDGRPDWLQELCHAAHGDYMPDDYRYEFIVDALACIEEGNDPDEMEPDCYTGGLTAWLASNINRIGYVDECLEEMGGDFPGLSNAIAMGQLKEMREVYDAVWAFLDEMVEEEEAELEAAESAEDDA